MKKTIYQKDFLFLGGVFLFLFFVQLLGTIYYIEDPDSLRFALAVNNFDPAKGIPHFPLYPVYVYLSKFIYFFIGKFSLTFSLIGWMSMCVISWVIYQWTHKMWVVLFLIVQSSLLLMANRYMPDLLGCSIILLIYYFTYQSKKVSLVAVLGVLLMGVRLSYFPFLFPVIITCLKSEWKSYVTYSFLAGFLLLSSLFFFASFEELMIVSLKQTKGHFNDFGGGITSENNAFFDRFKFFFYRLFSNGFGLSFAKNYWWNFIGIIALVYLFFEGIKSKVFLEYKPILWGLFLYAIWILFFQNIIYKFRHVLPMIPLLFLMLGLCLNRLNKTHRIAVLLVLVSSTLTSCFLLSDHKIDNSISQANKELDSGSLLVSSKLLNYMIDQQRDDVETWDLENIKSEVENDLGQYSAVYLIGNFDFFKDEKPVLDTVFYHNELVNPMWSELRLRKYRFD